MSLQVIRQFISNRPPAGSRLSRNRNRAPSRPGSQEERRLGSRLQLAVDKGETPLESCVRIHKEINTAHEPAPFGA